MRDEALDLEQRYQLAMIYAIERVAPNEGIVMLGAMTVLAHPETGITITVDWPKFLGCSEQDILDALMRYAYRQMDRFIREVGSCETAISQEVAERLREYRASDAAQDLAENWALRVWKFYGERGTL